MHVMHYRASTQNRRRTCPFRPQSRSQVDFARIISRYRELSLAFILWQANLANMFAVKGWSVDATSLKPQTQVFRPTKTQDGEEKKGKKRKRKHGEEVKQVSNAKPDDVGRLWEQHMEGNDLSKAQKSRLRKKQKLDQTGVHHKGKDDAREHEGRQDNGTGDDTARRAKDKKSKKEAKREQREKENGEKPGEPKKHDWKVDAEETAAATAQDLVPVAQPAKLTPMQSAMRQKLVSARFRHLNQTLYTAPSKDAQQLFDQDPAMFEDYHAGFRQQVSVWPENPVDKFLIEIRRRGKMKHGKAAHDKKRKPNAQQPTAGLSDTDAALPRTDGISVIADLGCGDARLGRTLTDSGDTKSLRLKMHSFDLHSPSPFVTKADISALPLPDKSVDVAIFCLALMGTNWISFIEEAHRILRWKGELWVAEIKSRFGRVSKSGKPVEHSVGGKRRQAAISKAKEAKQREQEEENEQEALQTEVDGVVTHQPETDVQAFVDVLKRRGFMLKPPSERHVDLRNKMFVKMEFVKALTPTKGRGVPKEEDVKAPPPKGKPKLKFIPNVDEGEPSTEDEATVLKPCLYKLR